MTQEIKTAPEGDIRQLVTDLERGGMNEYFDPVTCARGILTLVDVLEAEKVALATERDTLVVECKRLRDALVKWDSASKNVGHEASNLDEWIVLLIEAQAKGREALGDNT